MSAETDPRRGYHDIGGTPGGGPVDPRVTEAKPWEKLSVAIGNALGRGGIGVICTDETRRSREEMGETLYNELGYFEKGVEATSRLLIEKEIFTREELEARMAEIEKRIREHGR
jgi:nitrile hydratase subunit beta